MISTDLQMGDKIMKGSGLTLLGLSTSTCDLIFRGGKAALVLETGGL